jgi:hypothetical protein
MASTIRIYHNDNRISTAVRVNTGILQVYPTKRQFGSDVEWKQFWENELKPKLIMRFGDSESKPAPAPAPAPAPVAPVEPKAKLSNWKVTQRDRINVTFPAGEYYIGDLCYVLGDNVYDNIFGGTGYEPGVYEEKDTGRVFAVNSTAYGDGCYRGDDGNEFCVDAGIIGICSKSLMTKDDGGGHMYTFRRPVECRLRGGRFSFTDGSTGVEIRTDGWDGDDY